MKWHFPVLRGIRQKLLLSFSLLVASIALFVVVFFPDRLERQAMQAMVAKTEAIRDMTAYSLSAGLFFGDSVAVHEVLSGAAHGSDVQVLLVYDSTGATVAARGSDPSGETEVGRPRRGYVTADGALYVSSSSIQHGLRSIGTLTIGVSLKELRREVSNARRVVAAVGAIILLVGFLVVYAISTLVTRPLTAVSRTVRKIAAGDLTLRAVETSDAEVTQLVRAFNHMVDRLAGAQAELSNINQELESRVVARTAELTDAIGELNRSQVALTQSEAQARAMSELLQSLIDVAPQAIVAQGVDGRVTRWNKAAEDLFGWTAAEVLGQPVPYVPASRQSELADRKRAMAEDGRPLYGMETVRVCKDGSEVTVLVSVGILRDDAQAIAGYIVVLTDLTDRKSLEEQLRQSQKMEAIGRLAGGVAHDFNNMLTIITSCASVLLDGHRTSEEREDLEAISTSALRASALTRQLLMFSRKQVINVDALNVNVVVRDIVPMLRRLLRENIEFDSVLDEGVGLVKADPSQLEQVLMNLVVNASDAMPDGGTITVETKSVELDADYAEHHADVTPGRHVMLTVSDTGIGMDAQMIDKIFEPFFTTKPPGKGTGLGLTTTYAVISQLGGHIRVYSELGHGTVFKIMLPCATVDDSEKVPVPPRTPSPEYVAGGATVLLVEDEESVRRTIRRTLERIGFTILEAADGADGLVRAAEYAGQIDVVVSDLMMPGMNGRQFTDQLLAQRPGLRVVFMSGYTDDTVNKRGLVDATHRFLQKPFSGELLAKTIRELLQEASQIAA